MTDKLPRAQAALVDNAGVTTPPFYRYFQALDRLQAGTASAADIAAINAQIAAIQAEIAGLPKASYPTLQVSAPLTSAGLLQNGFAKLGLATLDDSGAGTFKLITRDSFGRLSGTKGGTTSDVPEGTNLYHTAARVLATVLAGLSTATNAAITAADTVLSALGKLQAQITALFTNKADKATTLAGYGITDALSTSGGTSTGDITLAGTNTSLRTDKNAYSQLTFADGVYGMRLASAGSIALFCAGAASYSLLLSGTSCVSASTWVPVSDNSLSFGSASLRWSVIYAATGAINTSDARDKTEVAPLTAAELASAAELSSAIGTYQWLSSIAEKGEDKARHHAGLTVQNAIAILHTHGLDPFRYGFICYDKWDAVPEVTDPETGAVIEPARDAGDRYSFRPDELNLFLARGFAARLDALENRAT